ncbi:MAG: ornithine cyclodeaminase family protein, partial [Clostridia bacterium]|nr:ornithine cyclodeaminase family protein [Clostridia bacterium]
MSSPDGRVALVGPRDVARLFPMERAIAVMRSALVAYSTGAAEMPPRAVFRPSGGAGALGLMPGFLADRRAFGVKAISVFPGNRERGLESHQGFVLLFDPDDGRPLALVDAASLTAVRTAAVSAVATGLLAREGARVLALLGAGTQARAHLEAMACVMDLAEVRVWSRTAERAEAFAASWAGRWPVRAVATAEAAVRGADVVCTLTSAREPVLFGDWLAPGQHVNAVGASRPPDRELDSEAVARARVYVDSRKA